VLELYFIETALVDSITENSLDPYTCLHDQYPAAQLACLDVASVTTLSGTINSSYAVLDSEDVVSAVFYASLGASSVSTNYWGNSQRCGDGKLVGDGVLDSLDIFAYLAWYFGVSPYDGLGDDASAVVTVEGETDVGGRCGDGVTRTQYLAQFDATQPCVRPSAGRRLSSPAEPPRELNASVYRHREVATGAWYLVRIDSFAISLQLRLDGIANAEFVSLSNERAPWRADLDATPRDAAAHELRFARHAEYGASSTHDCAPIVSTLTGEFAMYRDVLALAQIPGFSHPFYCPFDVYVYVPDAPAGCSVTVAPGSRAIDGMSGAVQRASVPCTAGPYAFASPPSAPPPSTPPPSAPPPSAPPPSAPPPSAPPPSRTALVLAVVLSTVAVASVVVCAYRRYARDLRAAPKKVARGARGPARTSRPVGRKAASGTRRDRPDKLVRERSRV
jgi:hypothetical protein